VHLVAVGQRVAGVNGDVHRLGDQVQALHADLRPPGSERVLAGQGQVEVPAGQGYQAVFRLELLDAKVDLGRDNGEPGQDTGEKGAAEGRGGPDPQHPPGGAGVVREVGLGRLEQGEPGPGLLGEALTGRGEHGSAAAAVDQRHVQLPLEGRELLRDRRSGERQRAGGSSDTPVLGDG